MPLALSTLVRAFAVFTVFFALAVAAAASAQPTVPAGSAQAEAAAGEALFVLSGRGYGHGVGMSQYGAYGMANAGHSYKEILAHYYAGTELGRAPTKEVRVLLSEGRQVMSVSSAVPFTIVDGAGKKYLFPKGPLTVRTDLKVPTAAGRRAKAVPPLVVRPGKKALLGLDGQLYRGKLEAALQGGLLRIVNVTPLESYLQGVIANEMPHTWPAEALRAQAVAARSYALASLVKGKSFDLYSDVRSQVYQGVAGERSRTSDAVRATAGRVVLHDGDVATTFYCSSSGGKTASAADVFGSPVPYLVSRPDPWDKISPWHRWGPILFGARTLQSKFGVDARVLDATGVPTASGRLRTLTLHTAAGPSKVPAGLLRTSLGLRSTWVTIGVLRLDQPRETVVFGSSIRLEGIARGLPSPMLAASPDGSSWGHAIALERDASGSASISVKPVRSTRYRIEVNGAASSPVLVRVAPRVQLLKPENLTALTGTVRPKIPGADVTIERREGNLWVRVAVVNVNANGDFRAPVAVVPGSYRARVAATDGFAEGVGDVLVVTR
jgi:stage II sporulation protein D